MMERKRILSLIMCIALVVGLLPTGAWAVDDYNEVVVEGTTETKTVYVLVSTPTAGNQYLIVSGNTAGSAYALKENTTTGTSVTINAAGNGISAPYIETSDKTIMWNAASGMTFQSENGGYYLRQSQSNGSRSLSFSTRESTNWTVGTNTLSYKGTKNTYYDSGGSTWSLSSSSANVYFYEKKTITYTPQDTYTMSAADVTHILDTSATDYTNTEKLAYCLQVNGEDAEMLPSGGSYNFEIVEDTSGIISGAIASDGTITFSGKKGEATVKVSYTWTVNGESKTVYKNVTVTATETYYTVDITKNDNDDDLTNNVSITQTVAIKGEEAMAAGYDLWAVVYKNGTEPITLEMDKLSWVSSDTNVATVDEDGNVTFVGEGVADITVMYQYGEGGSYTTDTVRFSVSKSMYITPDDGTNDFPGYPNEGSVRFDKHATAVGNFNETGIAQVELSMTGVPYTTGSEIDVVLMLDMTGSMTTASMAAAEAAALEFAKQIVLNEDGTYNKNRISVQVFTTNGVTVLWELSAVTADNYSGLVTAIESASTKQASGGTPYSTALQACYNTLNAAKTDGVGDNRQQFCVFVSDGTPTSMTMVSNYDAVKNGTATTYTTTTSSSYYTTYPEYYSTLMKDNGVTVYGVYTSAAAGTSGSGSGNSGGSVNDTATATAIMENIASSDDKVYVLPDYTDTSAITNAFTNIAQSIKQAATNVMVQDKIADEYTMILELPDSFDTDEIANAGLSGQEFYIEALEYTLDENKNRNGDGDTLSKIYLGKNDSGYYAASDANGTPYSSPVFAAVSEGVKGYWTQDSTKATGGVTVNGYYFTANGDGEYNMSSGAYISGTSSGDMIIAAPTFVYNANTRMLAWTAEKIAEKELALRYFLYLENSGGVSEGQTKDPGTYETNDYATLTYDNYQGHRTQQEFPVPQMTWNGAQVSLVFYMVNKEGKPVNKEGKEVPFAEAVYITEVFTEFVYWNTVDENKYYEAALKAEDYVPSVYELFDKNASYTIHVFADQEQFQLDNHFVIGGSSNVTTTDSNGSDKQTTSTHVMNSKAGEQYTDAGVYSGGATYRCKDFSVTYADGKYTYTGTENQATFDEDEIEDLKILGATIQDNHAYFKGGKDADGNDQYYTIVTKSDATEISGFDFYNTTVAFAVYWVPSLVDDTVVIDYGLDVNIDVTTNDQAAGDLTTDNVAGLFANLSDAPNVEKNIGQFDEDTFDAKGYEKKIVLKSGAIEVGQAEAQGSNVIVSLNENGMQLSEPIVFYYVYEIIYYAQASTAEDADTAASKEKQKAYMYSSVTVIPASTVYYEENFVTFDAEDTTPTPAMSTIPQLGTGNVSVTTDDAGIITEASYVPSNGETQATWADIMGTELVKSITDTPHVYNNNVYYQKADGTWYTIVLVASDTTVSKTGWTTEINSVAASVQDTDRPGDDILAGKDANNHYGYDSHYTNCTTYSQGRAMKTTVNAGTYATAAFTFTGTGFDLIGLTSNETGIVTVDVDGSSVDYFVDTYYGYTSAKATLDDDGNVVVEDAEIGTQTPATIYQVPVLTVRDLAYGTHKVTITVSYHVNEDVVGDYDHVSGSDSYDFYLDAVRIYDPTGVIANYQETGSAYILKNGDIDPKMKLVTDAYIADSEWAPDYEELGNELLTKYGTYSMLEGVLWFADGIDEDDVFNGEVFVDGNSATDSVLDYAILGPNNEVYLASGQTIAIMVDSTYLENVEKLANGVAKVQDIQLGIKLANGSSASVVIGNYSESTVTKDDGTEEKKYVPISGTDEAMTLTTATDMYYSIMDHFHDVIVIKNTGSGMISLTNIKVTFKPEAEQKWELVTENTEPDTATENSKNVFQVVADFFVQCFYSAVVAVDSLVTEVGEWLSYINGSSSQ